ncbi:MAG TPA: hypothetical protein VH643_09715 [Gemmataceae bacterium]|jgi:hypothetical protein
MGSDPISPAAAEGPRRAPALRRWLPLVLLFLLPLGLFYAPRGVWQTCDLVIDMQAGDDAAGAGSLIEVWANSPAGKPLRQHAMPGARHAYRFHLENYQTLDYLRIDPTDTPGQRIRLYGVCIQKGNETVHSFSARDLAGWATNAEQAGIEGDALVLRASHNDPQLAAHFGPIALPGGPRNALSRLGLKLLIRGHDRETLLALLAVAVLIVLGVGLRAGGRWTAVVVAVSVPLTYQALKLLRRFGGHPPSGEAAVGYALYTGYSKSLEFLNAPLLVAVPALVALLAVYLWKRRAPARAASVPAGPALRRSGWAWAGGFVVIVLAIGLAAYFCPDLAATCPTATSRISPSWDSNNILVWQYLAQTGAKPFKDFWYPYGGQILFELAFPHGDVLLALHRFLLFAVFLLAVHLNTRGSLAATPAVFGVVFALYAGNYLPGMERYGLIVNVVLAYAAIDHRLPRLQGRHVLFWIAAVQAVVIEPSSALYAGVPLLVSCALDALRAPAEFRSRLVGRVCRDFAPPAAAVLVVGIHLAVRGELTGFLSFMASLGAQAAYSANPIDLRAWLRGDAPNEAFLLWSIVVLTGAGLVHDLTRGDTQDKAGRVVLLLGVAAAMVMLKQIVRPHMAAQILIFPIAGSLFYLFACREQTSWQRGATALAAGLLFAYFCTSSIPAQVGRRIGSAVSRAKTSAPFLALDTHQRQLFTAMRFAPEHFQLSDAHHAVLHALARRAEKSGRVRPLFVLSDDPLFYILAGARPYFHTNGYNAAPIQEQKRIVQLLEAEPPEVVIWRFTDVGMDLVPPVVRNALVYDHVIRNYVPAEETPRGPFALLRRRRPEEPVAVDFWREHLSLLVHLGHIPRFSSMARFKELSGRPDEEVAEFLTVKVRDPDAVTSAPLELPRIGGHHPAGRSVIIPVECDGRRFVIGLSVVPGQSEYHVLLNRVWFWGALRKAGRSPTLGDAGPGIELRLQRRAMNEAILY